MSFPKKKHLKTINHIAAQKIKNFMQRAIYLTQKIILIFPVRMISKNLPTLSLSLSSLNRRCSWAPCSSNIACSHFLANSSTSQFRARIFVSIWKLKFHVKVIENVSFLIVHSKRFVLSFIRFEKMTSRNQRKKVKWWAPTSFRMCISSWMSSVKESAEELLQRWEILFQT